MSNENRKYRFATTSRTATFRILLDHPSYEGFTNCVGATLSCQDCLIAQGFENNPKIDASNLSKLHSEAVVKRDN